MAIFASCGHQVASIEECVAIEYDDEEIDHDAKALVPIVVTGAYCPACAVEGVKKGRYRYIEADE